jgi:hypothetical protein
MRQLSAIDAIGPAWTHTSRLLFAPRSWRLVLKIAAVAFFAQMGGCNPSFNSPGRQMNGIPHAAAVWAAVAAFAVIIGLISVVVALVFFYISSRLQFTIFEVVLRSDTTVAPIWGRYGRATWYWMALKFLFLLLAMLCLAPFLIPLVMTFIHAVHANGDGNNLTPAFIGSIVAFIGSVLLMALVIGLGYTLLRDFGLPSMALEGTPLGVTVKRVFGLLRAEPGQVLLYLVMRFVLAFAGAIAGELALALGMLIALIPFGGVGVGLWAAFRHAGVGGHVVMIGGWCILVFAFLLMVVLAAIIVFGSIYTFLQAYALYFLGGRYPLLGNYLEPAPPAPEIPPGYPEPLPAA